MKRFLLCSLPLVLLYPAGIDMYLVGLPRIAADLNASEAQLHISPSVFTAGMATATVVCREDSRPVRPQAGRDRRRARLYDGLTALFTGVGRLAISEWAFSSGSRRRRLLCGGVRHSARHARRASPGESAVIIEWDYLYCAGTRPGGGAFDYASFPRQSLFYTMSAMGIIVGLLSLFILRETRPVRLAPRDLSRSSPAAESLINRFSLVDWRSPPLACR